MFYGGENYWGDWKVRLSFFWVIREVVFDEVRSRGWLGRSKGIV